MQVEVAADTAVGTDRAAHGLLFGFPVAHLSQIELGLELQRVGRAHGHTVAAIHTCRVGKLDVELGGDSVVEPAAGHGDCEGPLGVLTTCFDALVAEHAAVIGPNVEIVFDLDLVGHSFGGVRIVAVEVGAVVADPSHDLLGLRHIRRGRQELEHHLAVLIDALGVRGDDHAVFGWPRT